MNVRKNGIRMWRSAHSSFIKKILMEVDIVGVLVIMNSGLISSCFGPSRCFSVFVVSSFTYVGKLSI